MATKQSAAKRVCEDYWTKTETKGLEKKWKSERQQRALLKVEKQKHMPLTNDGTVSVQLGLLRSGVPLVVGRVGLVRVADCTFHVTDWQSKQWHSKSAPLS